MWVFDGLCWFESRTLGAGCNPRVVTAVAKFSKPPSTRGLEYEGHRPPIRMFCWVPKRPPQLVWNLPPKTWPGPRTVPPTFDLRNASFQPVQQLNAQLSPVSSVFIFPSTTAPHPPHQFRTTTRVGVTKPIGFVEVGRPWASPGVPAEIVIVMGSASCRPGETRVERATNPATGLDGFFGQVSRRAVQRRR